MVSVLDKIIEGVRGDLAIRETKISHGEIKELSLEAPSPIDTMATLAKPGVQVVAEVKRASPSKGKLADIPSSDVLAAEYGQGDAAVISCLTEGRRFRGSLADLDAVRRAVNIPVLHEDFIVTPYQVHETRAHGADLVLLICSTLDRPTLESLLDRAESLGMNALVETHTTEEVERAETAGAKILGINTRNLETLDVDLSVYERLAPVLSNHVVEVAESGVKGPEESRHCASYGADVVLVGGGPVTTGKSDETCQRLAAAGIHPTLRSE